MRQACGTLGPMTAPADRENPQPRDIALEQETPEVADDLESQSPPDAAEPSDGS
jgi:hypothetical protein